MNNSIVPIINKEEIVKKSCKLCSSKNRKEAEECYASGKSMMFVYKLLIDKFGEDISYPSVRNHLVMHYDVQQKALTLNEYGENLQHWMDSTQDRETELRARLAILKKQMFMLAAQTEGLSLDEQRKTAGEINKLVNAQLLCEKALDEKLQERKQAEIVIQKLNDIITMKIKNHQSGELRQILTSIINELKESMADIILEEN